jgi:hypothetical protein
VAISPMSCWNCGPHSRLLLALHCPVCAVVDAGSHGTHVAGITAAHHPEDPALSGIAPGGWVQCCAVCCVLWPCRGIKAEVEGKTRTPQLQDLLPLGAGQRAKSCYQPFSSFLLS